MKRSFFVLIAWLVIAPVGAWTEAGEKLPLIFDEDFAKGAERWQPTDPAAWKVVKTDKGQFYSQFRESKYKPPFRSPLNISLFKDAKVTDFVLEAKLRSTAADVNHRDMCLYFGYQDPAHFHYVHLGREADDHSNQIFIVNGEPRKKISATTSKGTKWDEKWHNVKIVRRVADGTIEIYFDDMRTPVMTAQDKTLLWGQVGIGSFDDIGDWEHVKLHGKRYEK